MKKGSKHTIESRKKLSISHLGQIPWNKGLIGQNKQERVSFFCKKCNKKFEDLKSRKRVYCSRLCAFAGSSKKVEKTCLVCSNKFLVHPYRKAKFHSRKCYAEYRKTLVISKETRKKMSQSKKGEKHPMYGTKLSPENKEKLRLSHLGKKLTKEQIKKCLHKRPKSGLETKVEHIIDKYHLPYKYVGNGKFFIERINPDFINTNGKKIAVEVYYRKHKDEFRQGGCEGWMKNRIDICNKYGWKMIFIEGQALTEEKVLHKLEVLNFIIARKESD